MEKTDERILAGDRAFRQGLTALREGRLDDAMSAFDLAFDRYTAAGLGERAVLVLLKKGMTQQAAGAVAQAMETLERALELSRNLNDIGRIAMCESTLATLYLDRGDPRAEALLLTALDRYRALEDANAAGAQLGNLGLLYQGRGEFDKARGFLEEAAAVFVSAGNEAGAAASLRAFGDLSRKTGEHEVATDAFERSLVLCRQSGDLAGEAYSRRALGQLRLSMGHVDVAIGHFRTALNLHVQAEDVRGASAAHLDLGNALIAKGSVDEGLRALEESVRLAHERGLNNESLASALLALGTQQGQRGLYELATGQLEEAEAIYARLGDPHGLTASRLNRAGLDVVSGHWDSAEALLQAAAVDIDAAGLRSLRPSMHALRGQLAQLRGRVAEAEETFGLAVDGFREVGKERLVHAALISRAIMRMEMRRTQGIAAELAELEEASKTWGNTESQIDVKLAFADLARVEKRYDDAILRYGEAEVLLEPVQSPIALSSLYLSRAEVRLRKERWDAEAFGELSAVEEDLLRSTQIAEAHGFQPRFALGQVWLAELARRQGDLTLAQSTLARARSLAESLRYTICGALAAHVGARVARDRRDATQFAALFEEARAGFERMEALHHLEELCEDFE